VHIEAVCPFCQTTVRVNPELRGQQLRCVNSSCRRVFTVEDKAAAQPAARRPSARIDRGPLPGEGRPQQSGSVGDLVPILPTEPAAPEPVEEAPAPPSNHVEDLVPLVEAEFAEPDEPEVVAEFAEPDAPQPEPLPYDVPAPDAPAPAPTWREPPPVRRGQPAAPPSRRRDGRPPVEEAPAEAPNGPVEMAPGTWEAPPVRHPGALEGEAAGALAEGEHAHEPPYHHEEPIHPRRRRRWSCVAALLLFLLVPSALGVGGYLVYINVLHNEEKMAAEADAEYKEGKFRGAADRFQGLATTFPSSESKPRYEFMQQLADYRARVGDAPDNTGAALDLTEAFLRDHNTDPQLQAHARDLGQTLVPVLKHFNERNAKPRSDEPLATIARAQAVLEAVQKLNKKEPAIPQAELQAIRKGFDDVHKEVAKWQHRKEVMQQLANLEPSAASIEAAKRLVKAEEANFPGLGQADDVVQVMNKLFEGHQASVVYVPAGPNGHRPAPEEDREPSLLFDPLVGGTPGGAPPNDAVVLALARGVLYALNRSNGEVKWTMRVGIDTAALPVTVPARVGSRERILVLSADTETLTAVDADGNQLWAYRLSKPCLGRPVVVDQRAYLPTTDGWVHEIELVEGRLIGRYNLGQSLTMGGAREGRTSRLYFPANDSCVYVLDVKERRCVGILYSGHRADSLGSEPIVIAPDKEDAPRFLVLNQKQGYEGMELKVFELPLADRHAAPLTLDPVPRLAGWTWFRPHHDDEKLVMVSDAAVLGLFGVRQANNQDPALFPLLQPGGLNLAPFLPPEGAGRVRAQVVHSQGDNIWVLANGKLQRLQLAWSEQEGLKPVAVWSKPRDLGWPLHSGQVLEDRQTGRSTLVVVTQSLTQQTCLATAVEDETGTVLWQRQLGLVCQGEPLEMTPPAGGPPVLLALDQGGGLYALDPKRFEAAEGGGWQSGGQGVLLARAMDQGPSGPPVLALAPDGKSAYEIAVPGNGRQLVVRHVQWGAGRQLEVTERKVALTAPLAGTPAVVGPMLVLPLADGALGRLRLPLPAAGAEEYQGGPDWRARRAPPDARCAVVALGPDRFLTTDGALGVTVWQWPAGAAEWKSLPAGSDPPTLELGQRVVGTPLALPAAGGGQPRVCVAGAGGQVTLLAPTADGGLKVQRTWEMGKPMTTGPFLCRLAGGAVRVGCLSGKDNSQLAWLDPERGGVRWTYVTPRGEAIVGLPQRAGNLLIVADGAGRFVGLDVETGKPEGPGYALRGSVAPAAGLVPFGRGRLFASLSDGTALLLPLKYFRHPLRDLPLGW
jgi:outer membrane protein assembly factor BamB